MALYLVQHGKNLPKEQDPQKGLSKEGLAQVQRIAQVAGGYGLKVSCIQHSGKKRAVQTAEVFAQALKPPQGIQSIDDINPLDDVSAFAPKIDLNRNVMLVGHLPFMERLISFLIISRVEPPVFKMQNGGVICLDRYPDSEQIVIKWALMPMIG